MLFRRGTGLQTCEGVPEGPVRRRSHLPVPLPGPNRDPEGTETTSKMKLPSDINDSLLIV